MNPFRWVAGSALALVLAMAAPAAPPTVADARAFADKAEAELLRLSIAANRADWIAQTYITDDTEAITALEGEKLIARTTELVGEAKKFEALNPPADIRRKFLLMKLSLGLPAPAN